MQGPGPAELDALGVAAAEFTFEGGFLFGVEIHMPEGAGQVALAAADTLLGVDFRDNAARLTVDGSRHAGQEAGGVFTGGAAYRGVAGFTGEAHYPDAGKPRRANTLINQ